MERPDYLSEKNILILQYSIYTVGIIGHLFAPTRELMFWLTPFTLFISILLVFLSIVDNKQLIVWLIVTYLITLLLEIIGVKTGLIFGEYSYGNILGIKFFEVPLIIGLNWVIIIWGGILLSQKLTAGPYWIGISTGAFALLFDIMLEPVAISFGYWNWEGSIIPLQNYLAWFIIAFAFSFFYSKFEIKTNSSMPIHLFFVQLVFFFVLSFVNI